MPVLSAIAVSRSLTLPIPARLLVAAALLEAGWLGFWVAGSRLGARAAFAEHWQATLPPVAVVLRHVSRPVDAVLGPGELAANVALLVFLVAAAFLLYASALHLACRTPETPHLARFVVASALVFQFTLFWMPNLFSTDLFSYAVYGQIAGRFGGNPYLQPPLAFPESPLLPFVSTLWQKELSVYGPVWTALAAAFGAVLPPADIAIQALAYKAVANIAQVASLALVWTILGALGRPRAAGLLLFSWNPVVLFEVSANGHNDAVMVALMLGAVLLVVRRQEVAGMGVLALAAMVKYTAGLLAPYLLVVAARRYGRNGRLSRYHKVVDGCGGHPQTPARTGSALPGPSRNEGKLSATYLAPAGGLLSDHRWKRLHYPGLVAAVGAGVVVIAYWPWWDGPATLAPVFRWTAGPMFANSPVQLVIAGVGGLLGWLGVGAGTQMAEWLGRLLSRGALVAFGLWEARRLRQASELPAAGARLLTAFLLLGSTWVLPWYYVWPTALAALAGPETRTARVVIGFDFTALGLIYAFHFHGQSLPPWAFPFYLSPLLLALGRRQRFSDAARRGWPGFLGRRGIRTDAGRPTG